MSVSVSQCATLPLPVPVAEAAASGPCRASQATKGAYPSVPWSFRIAPSAELLYLRRAAQTTHGQTDSDPPPVELSINHGRDNTDATAPRRL